MVHDGAVYVHVQLFGLCKTVSTGQFFVQKGRFLCLTYNPTLVLTASDGKLVLQTRGDCDNGAANQMFKFDNDGGLLVNQGDEINIEITACTKTKVCTYTVTGPETVQQACYTESGLNFCCVCGPLLPGRVGLHRNIRQFSCVMGEAESDPEAPRISPFKFIPRPKLKGEDAHKAQQDVEKIIEETRERVNEAPAPIQIKLCKNHYAAETGQIVQIRTFNDIMVASKRLFNLDAKRIYTSNGKMVFNFDQVTKLCSEAGSITLWVSSGDGFSTVESHLEPTKFVKNIDKKPVYSQGKMWKKVLVTADRNLSTPPVAIQGRSMEELLKAATTRLGLHTEVQHFIGPNNNEIKDFDQVPVFKESSEMSLNVLEIYYKFKNTGAKSRSDFFEKNKGTRVVLGTSTNQKDSPMTPSAVTE